MRYKAALEWLYGLESRGVRLGTDRMRRALAVRGAPQEATPCVHVAGSNGKGSVCAMVEAILRSAGCRTGLFSSPHVHRYVERVRINGSPISEQDAARWLSMLRAEELPLTFFEHSTLLAWEMFREQRCDVAVIEVGLGGRLDATNVIVPRVSVITQIGLDHQRVLGDSLEEIAGEKAGVLKPGVPAVVGVNQTGPLERIRARARSVGAPLRVLGEDIHLDESSAVLSVTLAGRNVDGITLGLPGAHQRRNGALAASVAMVLSDQGFNISDDAIRQGLRDARWPARLEFVPGTPNFLFDAAHNADGCRALAAHLRDHYSADVRAPILLFAALADKQHEEMLAAFDSLVSTRVYSAPNTHRAVSPSELGRIRAGHVVPNPEEALAKAQSLAGDSGLVVVAGSIHFIGEVRAKVLGIPTDPPIAM